MPANFTKPWLAAKGPLGEYLRKVVDAVDYFKTGKAPATTPLAIQRKYLPEGRIDVREDKNPLWRIIPERGTGNWADARGYDMQAAKEDFGDDHFLSTLPDSLTPVIFDTLHLEKGAGMGARAYPALYDLLMMPQHGPFKGQADPSFVRITDSLTPNNWTRDPIHVANALLRHGEPANRKIFPGSESLFPSRPPTMQGMLDFKEQPLTDQIGELILDADRHNLDFLGMSQAAAARKRDLATLRALNEVGLVPSEGRLSNLTVESDPESFWDASRKYRAAGMEVGPGALKRNALIRQILESDKEVPYRFMEGQAYAAGGPLRIGASGTPSGPRRGPFGRTASS